VGVETVGVATEALDTLVGLAVEAEGLGPAGRPDAGVAPLDAADTEEDGDEGPGADEDEAPTPVDAAEEGWPPAARCVRDARRACLARSAAGAPDPAAARRAAEDRLACPRRAAASAEALWAGGGRCVLAAGMTAAWSLVPTGVATITTAPAKATVAASTLAGAASESTCLTHAASG
jgi:hypothetical protein